MRTTIRIDDALYRAVKAKAAAAGRTVAEVIEDAVRSSLQERAAPVAELPPLPTFGERGLLPGVDLSSSAVVAEAMDEGVPTVARR